MIHISELQASAPHPNHPAILRELFAILKGGRGLRTVHLAHGSAPPIHGGTMSPRPRIVVCIEGENEMLFPQGDHVVTKVLRPHDAIFIPAGSWNYPTHLRPHTFLTLGFSSTDTSYFIRERLGVDDRNPPTFSYRRQAQPDRALLQCLNAIDELITDGRAEAIWGIVVSLIQQVADGVARETSAEGLTPEGKWFIVKDFVEDHLHESLTREDVADAAGIHPNHLSRLVKKFTGSPYITFLNERRLERAASLLKRYDLPVYEVGKQCGFPTPTHFSKVFRQRFSSTPGEYQKRARG